MNDRRMYSLLTDNKGNVTGIIDLVNVASVTTMNVAEEDQGFLDFTLYSGTEIKIFVNNPQRWIREIATAFGLKGEIK